MKKIISLILIGVAALLSTVSQAQPTNTPYGGLIVKGEQIFQSLATATNWAIVPYGTIGSKDVTIGKHRSRAFGGGLLALYNFNQFVGGGLGVDELGGLDTKGQLTLVSANVQLELPMQPLLFMHVGSFTTNFTLTPFVYSGVGTPIGSGGLLVSSGVTHEGEGINIDLYKFSGWTLGAGAAYIERQNAGVYSGNYENFFLDVHTTF